MNNLELMRKRLEYNGGIKQEDRMIKDKYRTFLKTLQYSYQGEDVSIVQKCEKSQLLENQEVYRALINPNKLKQDYDDKVLSIDYAHGYNTGDIFKWNNTDTYWIIYLRSLTENAYFRGDIRRCKYKIKFRNKLGEICETWAAIRGPVETEIESIQKNQVRLDRPNWSLNILLPLNEDTKFAFDRYSRFIFNEKAWQVQAVDSISTENILEISAEEYYIDRDKDDLEQGLAYIEIEEPKPQDESGIEGNILIKPLIKEFYTAPQEDGVWSVDSDAPVCLFECPNDKTKIGLIWDKTTSGKFVLQWSKDETKLSKNIQVDSLF